MSLLRPIHCYHSRADLTWLVGPFNVNLLFIMGQKWITDSFIWTQMFIWWFKEGVSWVGWMYGCLIPIRCEPVSFILPSILITKKWWEQSRSRSLKEYKQHRKQSQKSLRFKCRLLIYSTAFFCSTAPSSAETQGTTLQQRRQFPSKGKVPAIFAIGSDVER
jgi:hypothetical protein